MSATADASVASAVRPGLRPTGSQFSPHTPSRTYSSNFSSPGGSYRQEEDVVVLELGSRYLRAGFADEPSPQCCMTFGPDSPRRVGDYSNWQPGFRERRFRLKNIDLWSRQHELWQFDLRKCDLGLFEDKLERCLREVYNKYLLTDAGNQRLVIVLPSVIPHPHLSSILQLLFSRWKFSTIALWPNPTMVTLAAGLRSALVVDIGWQETTVTTVYEYREIHQVQSNRAMKQVVQEMARLLYERPAKDGSPESNTPDTVDFDFVEDIVWRLAHCRSSAEEAEGSKSESQPNVHIDMPADSSTPRLELPQNDLSKPVEAALLDTRLLRRSMDDEELTLPRLIFEALVSLEPDIRGLCMSRLIFVGGGSRIPGLSKRVLDEVAKLNAQYKWTNVRGEAVDNYREKLSETNNKHPHRPIESETTAKGLSDNDYEIAKLKLQYNWNNARGAAVARHREKNGIDNKPADEPIRVEEEEEEPTTNEYVEKLERVRLRDTESPFQGRFREVKSLGAWAGASLSSSMKIRGVVEVDRERFLQHGLAGALREGEVSVVPQRQSFGPGLAKAGGDHSGWTLAGWG